MTGTRFRILVAALAAVAVVLVSIFFAFQKVFTQPGPLAQPATVIIDRGAALNTIARDLHAQGVIVSRTLFKVAARIHNAHRNLKAGEYAFAPGVSLRDVLEILRAGRTVARKLTVAEGLTSKEIVALLASTEGLSGRIESPPAEGSLLPDTYHFGYGDSRTELIDRLTRAMAETLDDLWPRRAADLPFDTREEAVILASIVEKETALPEERPRIAALFINRLRKGMRLDADPTVAYGLNDGAGPLGRPLTFADLKADHPYNTYRRQGLPPGPICNPGRESLAAVLNPIETDELYFVADGTGGHAFARTLEEHNRNVARWRKVQRNNRIKRNNATKPGGEGTR